MSIAIVDVRGWQNTLDLASGEKTEAAGPIAGMMRDVLKTHPYPGDTDPGSNRWVSDTALDLIGRYKPRVSSSSPMHPSTFRPVIPRCPLKPGLRSSPMPLRKPNVLWTLPALPR